MTIKKRRKITPKKALDTNEYSLPMEPKQMERDMFKYTTLIYGREKVGKTTLAATYPKAIFLATEPGLRGLEVYAFNDEGGGVHNWDIFRAAVKALVKDKRKNFKTVVVDTVDRAYDYCLDWVCENRDIEYPGQDSSGKDDFGKSWRAVKQEFLEQIHDLVQSGYGIVFTSHAKEQTIRTRSGEKYDRIFPTMSNQARSVVEALVDFFFFVDYAKDTDGNDLRIVVCRGDELLWAGARSTPGEKKTKNPFPAILPMDKDIGFEILQRAFDGKEPGLDPVDIRATRLTSKVGSSYLTRERAKQNRMKGGTAIKKKKVAKKRV